MDFVFVKGLSGKTLAQWTALLARSGLQADGIPERTLLLYHGDQLAACGSRDGNVLKYIAVDPAHHGEDLTSAVLTQLRQDAFYENISRLFLYTKPANRRIFSSLMFYPVAETDEVLLMESEAGGISAFLDALPRIAIPGRTGAVVINGNPFTLGHRDLIEQAASVCAAVYVFVLSEDKSIFSFSDRLAMAQSGLADLGNVLVLPSGPYLISAATFPTYFLKQTTNATAAQCALDAEIFLRHYVPAFQITDRFVGTEPFCALTAAYNRVLRTALSAAGVALHELPRAESGGTAISASAVRAALERRDSAALEQLVPASTLRYLQAHHSR